MTATSATAPALTIFFFSSQNSCSPTHLLPLFPPWFHYLFIWHAWTMTNVLCSPAHLCQMLFPTIFLLQTELCHQVIKMHFQLLIAMPALVQRFDDWGRGLWTLHYCMVMCVSMWVSYSKTPLQTKHSFIHSVCPVHPTCPWITNAFGNLDLSWVCQQSLG